MITFYPTVSYGELGKYATIQRALLPASSWAREEVNKYGRVRNRISVPRIPETLVDRAADCGGFVATKRWGGDYRYSPEQYVAWCDAWRPAWAACMDYCCEDEVTSSQPGIVKSRQDLTTALAYRFWDEYRDVPWAWVPTIQGWTIADYQYHARMMKPLITEMYAHYGSVSAFRVGIGTLCARASAPLIREVVTLIASELPGIHLHLWGVKLGVLQSPIMLPAQVKSVDSGAWNGMFRTGRSAWKQSGYSQREWCFKVALPAYEGKIRAALLQPKQMRLLEEAML